MERETVVPNCVINLMNLSEAEQEGIAAAAAAGAADSENVSRARSKKAAMRAEKAKEELLGRGRRIVNPEKKPKGAFPGL